jgi:hypothetical protein
MFRGRNFRGDTRASFEIIMVFVIFFGLMLAFIWDYKKNKDWRIIPTSILLVSLNLAFLIITYTSLGTFYALWAIAVSLCMYVFFMRKQIAEAFYPPASRKAPLG